MPLLALLNACIFQLPPDPLADEDSDEGSWYQGDSDDDSDTRETGDWGRLALWYAGDADVRDGAFLDGHFGTRVTDEDDDVLCDNLGTWVEVGVGAECPDCAWSFELQVQDTRAEGPGCDELGFSDGEWDGLVATWAYAPDYSYGGHAIGPTLLFQYDYGYGAGYWLPFSWFFRGELEGDGESITFQLLAYEYGYDYDYDYE